MTEDSGPHEGGEDGNRSMSGKIDDMEARIDDHDQDIREVREDLEAHLDVLDSRIRTIESGATNIDSARKLYDYIVDVEAQISSLRDRLETALEDETPDN